MGARPAALQRVCPGHLQGRGGRDNVLVSFSVFLSYCKAICKRDVSTCLPRRIHGWRVLRNAENYQASPIIGYKYGNCAFDQMSTVFDVQCSVGRSEAPRKPYETRGAHANALLDLLRELKIVSISYNCGVSFLTERRTPVAVRRRMEDLLEWGRANVRASCSANAVLISEC